VQLWDVLAADATGRTDPRVLFSTPEARMVMIDLAAGKGVSAFIAAARKQRLWEREKTLRSPG